MTLSLIVLAAGLGSRFGGIKQMAAVDEAGHSLIDYSVYDAQRAGFDRIVCVVTPQLEPEFHERIGRHIARHVDLAYAHQTLDLLPPGHVVPPARVKPWGTAHAVLSALPQVNGDFATINADDFYGSDAYRVMADFLRTPAPDHALVGYRLDSTLSANGTVSRGVCAVADGRLAGIVEHTALKPTPGGATDEAGTFIPGDASVSLNFWGFRASAAAAFRDGFPAFLDRPGAATAEFFLPDVAATLIPSVRVLPTTSTWLGITYADDLALVRRHLAELIATGYYPAALWP